MAKNSAKKAFIDTKITVEFEGQTYPSLEAFLKIRKAMGPARFYMMIGGQKTDLTRGLFSAYSRLSNILDKIVATNLGGTIIPGSAGKGVVPDFITAQQTAAEIKSISTTTDETGEIIKASRIGVAGGRGVKLEAGRRKFITGVNKGELKTDTVDLTQDIIDLLWANRGNQLELKRIMSGKGNAVTALRQNFVLKSGDIRVPITIGKKTIVKKIGFTWNQIKKNPKAKIGISEAKGDAIFYNIYFTPKLVKDTLNKVNKKYDVVLKGISNEIAASLGKEFAHFSPAVLRHLEKANHLIFNYDYDSGSPVALIAKGTIKRGKGGRKATQSRQQFISGAQITTLVQKRMAQIMPKGPMRGPPLSSTVLTERSGRFRKSVKVVPNYRKNIMTFLYDPIYKTFANTPRNPDELIQKSLRETVQGLFARQFAIVRGN